MKTLRLEQYADRYIEVKAHELVPNLYICKHPYQPVQWLLVLAPDYVLRKFTACTRKAVKQWAVDNGVMALDWNRPIQDFWDMSPDSPEGKVYR